MLFDKKTVACLPGMTAGLALHLLLLLAPLVVLGRVTAALGDPAILAFLALASIFCSCDLATMRHRADLTCRRMSPTDDRAARRLALATGVVLLLLFWLALLQQAMTPSAASIPLMIAGGALMLLGSVLRLAAIRALREGFRTEFTPAGSLVRRGVYRLCRHPSETGLLSVALGACMLLSSVPALLMFTGVLLPLSLYRIHLEERRLLAAFGDEYIAYRRQIRRLLPLVF